MSQVATICLMSGQTKPFARAPNSHKKLAIEVDPLPAVRLDKKRVDT